MAAKKTKEKAQYTLYTTQAKTIRMSNDAFMFFVYGEEPLDEDNEMEIKGLQATYPYGFEVDYDSVKYPQDAAGKVEVLVTPYTLKSFVCDVYSNLGKYIYLCVDFLPNDMVHFWWYVKGRILEEGDRPILTDDDRRPGAKYFITRDNGRVYLDGLKKYGTQGTK